ncbi:MAG: hypothetical protein IPM71_16415 [Bacteroidota bacterium]|nr:MAG: hypothetical protein IPM71_16415 [Bacteroidota bacterium]
MTRLAILCFVLLTLTHCTNKNEPKTNSIEFSLYESYNLIELSTAFNQANELIRKYQLDSIAKIKTGLSLLDSINKGSVKGDSLRKPYEDFPLFSVLVPNARTDKNGNNYLDTSTILGWTTDTLKLKSYLNLSRNVFPEVTWITSKGFSNRYLGLHAIKNINKLPFNKNDIDSVIIEPTGPNSFGGVFEKISDLKGISKYRIELKLNSQLSNILGNNSYTLILKTYTIDYAGSVVNFKKFPGQYIFIGEMTSTDFQILKNNFESKMKIRK